MRLLLWALFFLILVCYADDCQRNFNGYVAVIENIHSYSPIITSTSNVVEFAEVDRVIDHGWTFKLVDINKKIFTIDVGEGRFINLPQVKDGAIASLSNTSWSFFKIRLLDNARFAVEPAEQPPNQYLVLYAHNHSGKPLLMLGRGGGHFTPGFSFITKQYDCFALH